MPLGGVASFRKALGIALLLLLANTVWVATFVQPTVAYMGNVLLHLVLGAVLLAGLGLLLRASRVAGGLFAVSAGAALFLAAAGNVHANRWALGLHVASAYAAVAAFWPWVSRNTPSAFRRGYIALALAATVLPLTARLYRTLRPDPSDRIHNGPSALSMEQEGPGPSSRFFPSPSATRDGKLIPASYFMSSEACGECHKDVYRQWKSSMHHFASFNNQFYRKSVEYMQSVVGTRPSRWCAGCHDHALLFSGRFDVPIVEQVNTPEAQAGLGCVSCHSIVRVNGSVGNGGFTIEYPALHELAVDRRPVIRTLSRFLTYLDPEPHRRTFLKPFMRQQPAEYCSTCHKVHLDVPVNNYRWLRGFNDYDNWQASGVSGQGARSFYYPPESSTCTDCHMPLVPSRDPGHHGGRIRSHRFAVANMAVAHVNRDEAQIRETEGFLKSGFVSVDIFAVSPAAGARTGTPMRRRAGDAPTLMSTFAIGEEAEQPAPMILREVGELAAPAEAAARLAPGMEARLDVVVRTRKVGHFFPGGTVDAFDVWLEVEGRDAAGRTFFTSGNVTQDGRGPVENGGHFYRAFLLDANGSPIDKRNAWQARSTLYVRLIPPGAADVAHYRVRIPPTARGPLTFTARLNYRKFAHVYTQFAYSSLPVTPPDLPVVTLAAARAEIPLGAGAWAPLVRKQDRERWNDWGIGLLLQGDIKGAEYAFRKVTEAEPGYAPGWLNVARALIQEGETEAARPFVARAIELDPRPGGAYFFRAMVEKAAGDYDAALGSLAVASSGFPHDRVVLNQIARVLFLKRDYAGAVRVLDRVRNIDPEDLQMHYTLMLCYRGLGNASQSDRERRLFERFKADEASQAVTGVRRAFSPEDNNERQPIHEHTSTGGSD